MPEVNAIDLPNQIDMFVHCSKCVKELTDMAKLTKDKKPPVSPREYIRVEVGQTPHGLQVWCIRHELNVIHLDFTGEQVTVIQSMDIADASEEALQDDEYLYKIRQEEE